MPPETRSQSNTTQRMLAFVTIALIGLSVIAIIVQLLLPVFGVGARQLSHGAWPYLTGLPLIALPLGVLCIIALLVVNVVNRRRANEEASK